MVFRKGRSTTDAILCLESEIRKAQVNREIVAAVFFDVEKAYDLMWKEGLLIKIKRLGITGPMYNWIKDFLHERSIQVRINTAFSQQVNVENGTPQGSVIRPILFSIMIDDVFDNIDRDIGRSLFADDVALWKMGKNIKHIMKKLQNVQEKVEQLSLKWGFRFSVEKTNIIFFSRRKIVEEYKLKLYGRVLERVNVFRFLGVCFDSRLTWKTHIENIISKCKKVLSVMRCVAGKDWGADRSALKAMYMSLITSVFDFGCIAYSSASKSLLGKLDNIQVQALRTCCGAFRTTSIPALQVEMGGNAIGGSS